MGLSRTTTLASVVFAVTQLAAPVVVVTAFVPTRSVSRVVVPWTQSVETSTTLYYRDDVPPIGSAPRWETPNDFDQFLTQCSIQSFTFLLKSLRDDHTVRWLDDFTRPVFEKHSSTSAPLAAEDNLTKEKTPPPKVSLAEAAQSALLETDKALQHPSGKKTQLEESKSESESETISRKTSTNTNTTASAYLSQTKPKPMATKSLKNKKKNKSAFAKEKATKAPKDVVDPTPPAADPLSSNTGVSQLYTASSGIPPQQNNPPIVKKSSTSTTGKSDSDQPTPVQKNYSPFGQKPKAVTPAPLGTGSPFQPNSLGKWNKKKQNGKKQQQQDSRAPPPPPPPPFTAKKSGGFMPVPSTSPLYGGGGGGGVSPPLEPATATAASSTPTTTASTGDANLKLPTSGSVLKYHGLGILNNTKFPTWDTYFEQLVDQPKEMFVVRSNIPNGREIQLDIDPASLCRRMISVRAQIAEEFEHDLEVIANMGGLTLKSYKKMIQEIREQRAEEDLQQKKDNLEHLMDPQSMEDSIGNHNGAKSTDDVDAPQPSVKPQMQRANLLFLDRAVGEGDKADYAPSPLRKGNFDLLCLLATQEAIHRVLNDPTRQAGKSPERGSNQFLQDFYVTRLLSHFSGDQRYGRSDDFLEELLDCPPRMITIGSTNTNTTANLDDDKPEGEQHEDSLTKDLTYLVDPVKVAETILQERETVALQWKQHLEEQTKEDHMSIQKMVLAKVMRGTSVEECEVVDPDGNDVEDVDFGSCFE